MQAIAVISNNRASVLFQSLFTCVGTNILYAKRMPTYRGTERYVGKGGKILERLKRPIFTPNYTVKIF